MFSAFFTGSQQDWKLMVVAPLLCALFRWIFIRVYGPKEDFASHKEKWLACFRYGFWWGMDYNAYVFLLSWICVSLPGAFFPAYGAVGDTVRAAAVTVYAVVLYLAFAGKMIFYYHFQDIYNPTMRLGKNADKKNLADIFFHQNHGGLILLGLIPYTALVAFGTKALLATPVLPCPTFNDSTLRYGFHAAFVIAMVLLFYFFRYGGHLSHRWKPEWDTVPDVVKEDMFFAKACVDDLIAIEMVFKAPVQTILGHKDAESEAILRPFFPVPDNGSLWESLKRTAAGPRIPRPKHIFLIVGESYTQAPFDDAFAQLHLVDRGKRFRANPHTIQIPNFLPAGLVSQPAITSLIAGIFDDNLEINEKRPFWDGQTLTSLPRQLKQLGYRTALWYGGSLSWASLGLFAKGMGFDETYGGPDICPPHAPSTWLGVYDHLFLAAAFQKMCDLDDDTPVFHLVYTTSNHGPYTIPIRQYGFDPAPVAQELPDDMKRRQNLLADLETYWYTDQALSAFVEQVQQRFPDSLNPRHGRPLPQGHSFRKHAVPRQGMQRPGKILHVPCHVPPGPFAGPLPPTAHRQPYEPVADLDRNHRPQGLPVLLPRAIPLRTPVPRRHALPLAGRSVRRLLRRQNRPAPLSAGRGNPAGGGKIPGGKGRFLRSHRLDRPPR